MHSIECVFISKLKLREIHFPLESNTPPLSCSYYFAREKLSRICLLTFQGVTSQWQRCVYVQLCSSSMLLLMSRYKVYTGTYVVCLTEGKWKIVDSWDQGQLSVTFSVWGLIPQIIVLSISVKGGWAMF